MVRRSPQPSRLLTGVLLATLWLIPQDVAGQDAGGLAAMDTTTSSVVDRPLVPRSRLESRLETLRTKLDGMTIPPSTVEEVSDLRDRVRAIETRLDRGDFRQGDRVRLQVPADTMLSGTFSVNRLRELELPGSFDNVDLRGVLYAEIDSVAREVVARYIKNPRVRARVLWPVAITGGVSAPGYYNLPPGTTLSEALMEAGGPVQSARLERIEYRRGDRNLLESARDGEARPPVEVITLADLNARASDELHVPPGGGGGPGFLRIAGVVSGLSGTIYAITRIF